MLEYAVYYDELEEREHVMESIIEHAKKNTLFIWAWRHESDVMYLSDAKEAQYCERAYLVNTNEFYKLRRELNEQMDNIPF